MSKTTASYTDSRTETKTPTPSLRSEEKCEFVNR